MVWPPFSFSMMSASPAAARKVGSQSWCWMISFETTPAGIAPGLPDAIRLRVGAAVHVRRVEPEEERGVSGCLAVDEVEPVLEDLVVDRLHPLPRERSRVLDALLADPAPAWLVGGVVLVRGPAVQDAARPEPLAEVREVLGRRVVRRLRVLLGVEVVEVAEELVEAVQRGQELVAVAQVVLAELPGGVAERLEQLRDRRILRPQADRRRGDADLAQAGPEHALAGDERRPAGGAALLAVGVGEPHALVGDTVDVGRAVAHQPVAVAAQVRDADVIAPDHEDVRALAVGHGTPLSVEGRAAPHRGFG